MSFNKFIESLDELQELAFDNLALISIANLVLPEKEVLKKILADKIPGLSEEDIDLMAEAAFDNEEEGEDNEVDSEDEIEETKEEKKARKEREKEEKKAEKEQKKQQKEAEKQEKEAEKEKRKEQKEANKEKEKEEREKKKQERKEKLKEEREKRKEELKEIFKEKLENLKEEVKNLLNTIKSAIFKFVDAFLEVSKAFVLALIKMVTSLPGAVLAAVAPPFNVSLAIVALLMVITDYLDILSKINAIIPFMQPLRLLPNFLKEEDLKVLGVIMNTITRTLIQFYAPIVGFKKIIQKIIDFIKSLFGARKEKIFRQATRKLTKLGHIESIVNRPVMVVEGDEGKLKLLSRGNKQEGTFELSPEPPKANKKTGELVENTTSSSVEVFSFDENDNDEIFSLLDQFKITNTQKWGGKSHVSDYRTNPDFLLKELEDLENKIEGFDIPPVDSSEFDQFVYDVRLPDGTVIPNVSEEGLEYYRKKFELQINDITNNINNLRR
jgi:hypothetical protein